MATIKISGNKKLSTIRKEFNEAFPYLRIGFWDHKIKTYTEKQLSGAKTFASIRTKACNEEISISGNKKIDTIEAEFLKKYGVYCQIGWTSKDAGVVWTLEKSTRTLKSLSDYCETSGDAKKSLA